MSLTNTIIKNFGIKLLDWFDIFGRKDLPWQEPKDPYRTWVSEIMLQQTQVKTVIPYFLKFMHHFPTLKDLANATEDQVLTLWAGLGYYSRGRNLLRAAKMMAENFNTTLPSNMDDLISLPGIGESTAAAILSQAYGIHAPILDANVKRVLMRFFQIEGFANNSLVTKKLWSLAKKCMPSERTADYTQAIMDLGALICKPKNYQCEQCPVKIDCQAFKNNQVDNFPHKKIKRKIPLEQQQFLIMVKGNSIYLEKRPPIGIWGGLWCLPSINMNICAVTYIREHFSLQTNSIHNLPAVKHIFSHFRLELHPIIAEVKIRQISSLNSSKRYFDNQSRLSGSNIHETQGSWFSINNLQSLGLATPIKKILSDCALLDHLIQISPN